MNKCKMQNFPIRNPQSPLISSKSEHGDKSPLHVVLPSSLFSKENRGDEGENKGGQSAICNGFTLMELLVVIAIIGILAGILLPTLNRAREKANRTVCIGNLKVIGEAFHMYNIDLGRMPPTILAAGVYLATNQIKTAAGDRVGLGWFYNDPNLTITTDDYIEEFGVYVCPSSENYRDPEVIKQDWEAGNNTFSAYIYRAESGYPIGEETLMLSDAKPAIVIDYNCSDGNIAPVNLNHQGEYVNILFRNGYVKGVENKDYAGIPDPDGQLTLGGVAVDEDELFRHMCGGLLCGGADNYQ